MKNIPGPVGIIPKNSQNNVLDFVKELDKNYPGGIVQFKTNIDGVLLTDPKFIRDVLQKNQKLYVKSDFYRNTLKHILGDGLVTSEGELWKRQRKLIQPSFHKQTIANFFETMLACTNEMVNEWKEKLNRNNHIDFSEEMMSVTLQIIGKTMLSADVKKEAKKVEYALTYIMKFGEKRTTNRIQIPIWFPLPAHIKALNARTVLNKIIYGIIEERRKTKEKKGDLLYMLMESRYEDTGEAMSNNLLRDEIMTIFLAGHETTATALTWTFYLISQHPEVYKKIKKEIDEVVGKGEFMFQHFEQLKYTKACLDESMRLYPPVWGIGRKATEDNMVGDFMIKKDIDVTISIYHAHHHPDYWKNPEMFDPERWETEEVKQMDKFTYFPFGAGPRMCIGNNFAIMEAEIIMVKVIQNFSFEYLGQNPPSMFPFVTVRPKNGMLMKVNKVE